MEIFVGIWRFNEWKDILIKEHLCIEEQLSSKHMGQKICGGSI